MKQSVTHQQAGMLRAASLIVSLTTALLSLSASALAPASQAQTRSGPSGSGSVLTIQAVKVNPLTGRDVAGTRTTTRTRIAPGQTVVGRGGTPTVAPTTGGLKRASSGGCCSASGGWDITFTVGFNDAIIGHLYQYNSHLIFCWGGGVAGVHWGYVYNCNNSPGSGPNPYTHGYFSSIAGYMSNVHNAAWSLYYFGWGSMGNAYHTGFHDYQQGSADENLGGVYLGTGHPEITVNAHANGEYDWSAYGGF